MYARLLLTDARMSLTSHAQPTMAARLEFTPLFKYPREQETIMAEARCVLACTAAVTSLTLTHDVIVASKWKATSVSSA